MSESTQGRGAAVAWAHVCLAYHDLRLGANRHLLTGQWRKLRAASERGTDQLEDWLAFQQEILARDGDEDEYTRVPLYGADLVELEGPDDDEYDEADAPQYVCPTGQCARTERALFGQPPKCELRGRPMTPAPD